MKKFYTIIFVSVIVISSLLLGYAVYRTQYYNPLTDTAVIGSFIGVFIIYVVFIIFEINRMKKLDNYFKIYNKYLKSCREENTVIQNVSLEDAAKTFSYYALQVVEDYELKRLLKEDNEDNFKRIDIISVCYMIGISSHIVANRYGISYVTPFLKECYKFLTDSYKSLFIAYIEVMDSYITKASSIMHYEASSMKLDDILIELNNNYLNDIFNYSDFVGAVTESGMNDLKMFYDMSDKLLTALNIK